MDVQDAPNAVEEQKRLFEESFKRRRMLAATLPQITPEYISQQSAGVQSSSSAQTCSGELERLLNDLEVDPRTRESSRQLLEHVVAERERTCPQVSLVPKEAIRKP